MHMKPTVYLVVEIKAREFKSKVLLALFAVLQGFRVYLGTKESIDRLVSEKKEKGGIYFYKGGKSHALVSSIKRKCEYFVVLDEEMGPAIQELDLLYTRRIYPGTESMIDKLFLVGQSHLDSIGRVRPSLLSRAVVTGWPRVDLWKDDFFYIYSSDVSDIKSRYGEFFLFSSDFGINSKEKMSLELSRLRETKSDSVDYGSYDLVFSSYYQEYLEFIDLLRRLDKDDNCPTIIVRPHPAEDHSAWHKDLEGLKHVKCVYEGEITPWLLASNALLHRGCTTAVQAYVARIPALYCILSGSKVRDKALPFQVSRHAYGYNEIASFLFDFQSVRYDPNLVENGHEHIYVDQELACNRIVAELQCLNVTPEASFFISDFSLRVRMLLCRINEIRQKNKIGFSRGKLEKSNKKIPGGIHQAEVSGLIDLLMPQRKFSVVERDFNLVEIDACISENNSTKGG